MLSLDLNCLIGFPFKQTLCVQVKCFQEIISIGYSVYRVKGLPWFRSLSWYMLMTSNYYFYGESLVDYFNVVLNKQVCICVTYFILFTNRRCFSMLNP